MYWGDYNVVKNRRTAWEWLISHFQDSRSWLWRNRVKIDAEIIESIISGNEFSYIKEWLKLIKFVTKEIEYIECSDMIMQIQEDIFLYGAKKLYKLKHKKRSRKHVKFIKVIDYEITEEEDFGTFLTLSEILMLFEFQNSII